MSAAVQPLFSGTFAFNALVQHVASLRNCPEPLLQNGVELKTAAIFQRQFTPQNLPEKEIDQEFSEACRAISNDVSSTSPGTLSKVKKLLPLVKDRTLVLQACQKILHLPTSQITPLRSKLLRLLLEQGHLPAEEWKEIFSKRNLLKNMDERFLVQLFLSVQQPIDSAALASAVTDKKNLEQLLFFSFRHQLPNLFAGVARKISSFKFNSFIGSQNSQELFSEKLNLLTPLTEQFDEETVIDLLDRMKELSQEDWQRAPFQEFLSALICSSPFNTYLADERSTLEVTDLRMAFDVYFNKAQLPSPEQPQEQSNTLSEEQLTRWLHIGQELYLQDREYISRRVAEQLRVGSELNLAFTQFLPFLDEATGDLLNCQLQKMLQQGKIPAQKAKQFIEEGVTGSLTLWSQFHLPTISRYVVISKGSQIGKDGKICQSIAKNAITLLNRFSPEVVTFDASRLKLSLEGGTCSAMTFRVLKLYLEADPQIDMITTLKSIGSKVEVATLEFRTIQAAYNTIGKSLAVLSGKLESSDFNKDKIEALLNLENLQAAIGNTSHPINLDESNSLQQIISEVNQMSDGPWIVRSLSPIDAMEVDTGKETVDSEELKCKGEKYGHTTLIIKKKERLFYYDPAIGILQLVDSAQIHTILKWQDYRWTLPEIRFYEIC